MWSENDERRAQDERPIRSRLGSEVAVMDERAMAAAASATPPVANLNVSRSSRVHIGPKFVSVTQNVTEVVEGRFLGLGLVSPKETRRLRCSVAVFVCWAFIVASALAFFLLYYTLTRPPNRLDIGLNATWYLRRAEWQALPSYALDFLGLPLQYVVIGHSASNYCNRKFQCVQKMLEIQQDHLQRGFYDIGPNFLIGGNGYIFEGRGANVIGAMVPTWNSKSITIMFLGDYTVNQTVPEQFENLNVLLDVLVNEKVLTENYVIYGHCQITPFTVSPGPNIMHSLHLLPHWNPVNATYCLPR